MENGWSLDSTGALSLKESLQSLPGWEDIEIRIIRHKKMMHKQFRSSCKPMGRHTYPPPVRLS